MEIEYQNTKADFIEFEMSFLIKRFQKEKTLVFLIILLISLSVGATGNRFHWSIIVLSFISISIIYFTIFYLFPFIRNYKQIKIKVKDQSFLEKTKLSISDEGLNIESESKATFLNWESVKKANSNNKFIWLRLADNKSLIFPKRYFTSDSEAINFLGHLQIMIIKANGASISASMERSEPSWKTINTSTFIERSRPPYLLGLLCIVPLVGAFVGFGLLMFGIFKYKDKWLTIIGIAGIAWTVLFYSILTYQFEYGAESRKAFAQISQMQINNLMKDIEFYKIKYGTYPDSLGQIRKEDKMVLIDDPILSLRFSKKGSEFNYQKVGSHYYLFSSGLDGIPNTKDDFYPQVADADTSKFGLIRKQY